MSQGGTAVPITRIGAPDFRSIDLRERSALDGAVRDAISGRGTVQRRSRHVGTEDYSSATAGELLTGARQGHQAAWDEMVYRYTSLVMGIARAYRLTSNDALDVNQAVWLQVLLHVATIKEPEALPGWIATTARRACLRLATSASRTVPVSPIDKSVRDLRAVDAEVDAGILRTEMLEAVRDGFAE